MYQTRLKGYGGMMPVSRQSSCGYKPGSMLPLLSACSAYA